MLHQRADTAVTLGGVEASRAFLVPCFAQRSSEKQLWVAHVDREARCIHLADHQGDAQSAGLPASEILDDAARLGSAGVVLARASDGTACPAPSEIAAVLHLARAAEALDLTIIDHLTFAGADCSSMRRMGLL
jgi:DNA repair protein RadC